MTVTIDRLDYALLFILAGNEVVSWGMKFSPSSHGPITAWSEILLMILFLVIGSGMQVWGVANAVKVAIAWWRS